MQEFAHMPMSSFSQFHCRRDSGELDVFAATRYFSGSIDVGHHEAKLTQKCTQRVDMINNKHIKEKIIRCKQPSSPGAKLASFFNSVFQQNSPNSKKKKKSSKSLKGEEEQSLRRRRSSTDYSSKPSFYNSSSCVSTAAGIRTPSLCYNNREVWDHGLVMKSKEKGFRKEEEDGEQSDTSSDLFELKNYDLSDLSSGLPVYGSTDMGVTKRRTDISIASVAF